MKLNKIYNRKMTEDYLNGNIRDIIEPMISALLIAQPEDPKFFMLNWLV